ncbi:MAG: DUF1501 domain-containing protein [Isosphaeraceae bacterium]|nr:DUF1501 domain-containing protein [Isosphaeraceae bacterium]
MLNIAGRESGRFCDGVSRRDFLKVGGLAMGGMSLPAILEAEAKAGIRSNHKAVIMVFLAGGPPHQDMFDLKPDAPSGIRGDYKPIPTNVPGLDICEHMPLLAKMMDKFAVIRTIVGAGGDHSAYQCLTGYTDAIGKVQGGRPSLGSILSRLHGPVNPDMPPFVGLAPVTGEVRWGNPGEPGYLGVRHAPYTPFRGAAGFSVTRGAAKTESAKPGDDIVVSTDRLVGRQNLLGELDDWRRTVDASEAVQGMDTFSRRAFDILTTRRLFDALDVTKEDPRIRARYGFGDTRQEADGPPCYNDQFLMARRLVEAGARCVTLSFGRWDTHGDNFRNNAERIPKLDKALSALVDDLHMRGLDKDVSVVVWGEFGRTPKINPQAGRDHWPPVSFALLAGGGMRTGQVIGRTNKLAEVPKDRPVHFQEVFATLYKNLGLDAETYVTDKNNRPMYLLDKFEPIHELV